MQTPLALPSAARVHLRGSPVRAPRGTGPSRPSKPWVRASQGKRSTASSSSSRPYPKACVIGGGWAGFGAAWQLLKHGFDVTLLDSSPDPGGLSAGWRTANGRAVEAGCKGFWRHYGNIDALADELGISPFTPYTSSAFYSPKGKEVEAPVLGNLPRLPTPFGTLLYTSPYFTRLSIEDRVSALPLAVDLLRYDATKESYLEYDGRSARDLLLGNPSVGRSGASEALYARFLAPILCALMFAPPEELSAAAALDVLYGYVLAHQDDFDVRWCKGTIAEKIFQPWAREIRRVGGSEDVLLGGRRVRTVELGEPGARARVIATAPNGTSEIFDADVVVMATGVDAARGIVADSPELSRCPDLAGIKNVPSTDVIAVRLFLDKPVRLPNTSNVFAGFALGGDEDAKDVAGTFFDLCALHDEYADVAADPTDDVRAVVEVDMYNAGAVLGLSDAELVQVALRDVLEGCVPGVVPRDVRVVDSSVLRFKGGVTKFAPGTASLLPETRVGGLDNFFVAGDYVWQGPGSHGARGLSQEKALVSGLRAADAAAEWARRKTGRFDMSRGGKASVIRQTAPDEDHVAAAKVAARAVDELERSNPIARLIKETTTGGGSFPFPGAPGSPFPFPGAPGSPFPFPPPGFPFPPPPPGSRDRL